MLTLPSLRGVHVSARSIAFATLTTISLAGCLQGSIGKDDSDAGDTGSTVACDDDMPCADGLMCLGGLCVGEGSQATCTPDFSFADGCQGDELCYQDPNSPFDDPVYRCYPMPRCPDSGECPVGQYGSVCNEQLIAGKDRICLLGMCLDASSDCNANQQCVADTPGVLGFCSDGAVGSYCLLDSHCDSGNCWLVFGEGICL